MVFFIRRLELRSFFLEERSLSHNNVKVINAACVRITAIDWPSIRKIDEIPNHNAATKQAERKNNAALANL